MKYPVFITLLFFLISASTGCNTFDPGYERNNPHDGGSKRYIPSKPSSVKIELEGRNIILSWTDNSLKEDGYIVEKAIDDKTNFKEIAKIPTNSTSYVDNSGKIGYTLFYKISSYVKGDSATVKNNAQSVEFHIVSVNNFNAEVKNNTRVLIEWNCNGLFADEFFLERKLPAEEIYQDVRRLPSCDDNEQHNYEFEVPDLEEFSIIYRISAYQMREDRKVLVDSLQETVHINHPIVTNIDFIDEKHTLIEWQDRSDFETGFSILEGFHLDSPFVELGTIPPDETQFMDTSVVTASKKYIYAVVANADGKSSKIIPVFERAFSVDTPILRSEPVGENSVKLIWYIRRGTSTYIANFIIERADNNGEYRQIAKVDPTMRSYTDTGLKINDTYKYRVKSLSSFFSNTVEVEYGPALVHEASGSAITNNYASTLRIFEDQNRFYVRNGRYLEINRYSKNGGLFIFDWSSLAPISIFDPGNYYWEFDISDDGAFLAELVQDSKRAVDLKVWNLSDETLIWSEDDLFLNPEQVLPEEAFVDWGSDGNTLVVSSHLSNALKIWDADTQTFRKSIDMGSPAKIDMALNPTSELVAVGRYDRSEGRDVVDIWSINNGQLLATLNHEARIKSFHFSGNGEWLMVADYENGIVFYNTANWAKEKFFGSGSEKLTMNSLDIQHRYLAIFSTDYNKTSIYDIETGQEIQSIEHGDAYSKLLNFGFSRSSTDAISFGRSGIDNEIQMDRWKMTNSWLPIRN